MKTPEERMSAKQLSRKSSGMHTATIRDERRAHTQARSHADQPLDVQATQLRAHIDRLTVQLAKAAASNRPDKATKIARLAALLGNQQARLSLILDSLATQPGFAPGTTLSVKDNRDKTSYHPKRKHNARELSLSKAGSSKAKRTPAGKHTPAQSLPKSSQVRQVTPSEAEARALLDRQELARQRAEYRRKAGIREV